jgi:prevent-host-death family protein
MAAEWKLQDAKNRFSELFERALTEGVQIVSRRGTKKVVIISLEEYERLTQPESSLSEFLLNSPFAGSELVIDRVKDYPRDIEIEP